VTEPAPLSGAHTLEYTYKRSVGPVLGRFFGGLRDGRIEGVKTAAGRVLCPPLEHDPETGEATTDDWVEVGPGGTVTTWAWIAEPRDQHPLDRPFAFALVQLDGADTGLLHAVDAGEEGRMRTGMRVRARFADERSGRIQDIACFEPEEA
jgi:uncharacterized OB-fold protein